MSTPIKRANKMPPEQQAIIDKCLHPTGKFIPFQPEHLDNSIPDRFEEQVRLYPARPAVKTDSQQLTYGELNRAANHVALAVFDEPGSVALLLEHGAPMIVGLLGVLKAGKVSVPMDPRYPSRTLTHMLEDSRASVLVTDCKNLPLAHNLTPTRYAIINLDEIDLTAPAENLGLSIRPESQSGVFYTSGSTGRPKGIIQNHRNLLHRTRVYTNTVHICQDDRITGFQSFSFRASEANLFGALLNGATFFPYDLKEHGSNGLADWLMRHEITIYYAITTAFRQFVATLRGGEEFPRIRLVKIGGETVVQRDVELFKTHFPRQCVFLNNYAPSESGIARWYFVNKDTRNADAIVPIGYRTEGTEAAVLDEAGHEVGFDQMGEIAIRGRYLSPGYWENGDLTDAKFLSSQDGESERIYLTGDLGRMSPDGCLTHLGRKDSQVKIRGYRIELAEIERVLLEIESVREAVVVARNHDNPGNQRLVAYVVPRSGDFLTFSEIRRILGASVPDYLVPSKVVRLDALPLTPTGKVDLVALPEPGEERPDLEQPYAVPRTPVEELLTEMWADVLGMEQVGIHDNFLDLGGDSLSAGRVISRVIDIFGIKISFRTLFDAPTVADMARVILHHDDKTGNQRDV